MAETPVRKVVKSRADLPEGENLCDYCTARCCRYFALPIDEPTTRDDFDNLRWYMYHGPVQVFVDDGTWYLLVLQECQHLRDDHRCGVYETRPQICRSYSTDNCEFDDDAVYDMYFETAEQMWEYAEAMLPPQKRKKPRRRPLKTAEIELPVVSAS